MRAADTEVHATLEAGSFALAHFDVRDDLVSHFFFNCGLRAPGGLTVLRSGLPRNKRCTGGLEIGTEKRPSRMPWGLPRTNLLQDRAALNFGRAGHPRVLSRGG